MNTIKPARLDQLFAFLGLLIPFASLVSGLGMVIVMSAASLFCLMCYPKDVYCGFKEIAQKNYSVIAVLLTLTGLNIYLAGDPNLAISSLMKTLAIFVMGGVVMLSCTRSNIVTITNPTAGRYCIIGFLIGITVLTAECLTDGFIIKQILFFLFGRTYFNLSDLNRGACIIALMLWISVLFINMQSATSERGNRYTLFMIAATLCAASLSVSLAALIATIIGSISFYLALYLKHNFLRFLKYAMPIMIIAFPGIVALSNPEKHLGEIIAQHDMAAAHRLAIWEFASEKALEKPLTGWGIGNSRIIPGGEAEYKPGLINMPIHPHNMPIQLFLEGGIVALLLGAYLVYCLFRQLERSKNSPHTIAAVTALLMAYLSISFPGFGIWQNWWIATLWIVAAFTRYAKRLNENNQNA
jgi:O-antigen ligase